MSSQRGEFEMIVKDGKTEKCVSVVWHTRDPKKNWYVNAFHDGKIVRCRLVSLLDRRPHKANKGFTHDFWSFKIMDEKTFQRVADGSMSLPPLDA